MDEEKIRAMTLAQLRRFAIESGVGISYLSERKKAEILQLVIERLKEREVA